MASKDCMGIMAGAPRSIIANIPFPKGPYTTWDEQLLALGVLVEISGRTFRFAYANEDLSPGDLGVWVPATQAVAVTEFVAAAIGSTKITISTAGITANDFQNGFLCITDGAGAGQQRQIKSHTATVLTLYYEIDTAIDATTTVGYLVNNPYVIGQHNAGQTEIPMGQVPLTVASGDYFLLCVGGLRMMQTGVTTLAAGKSVVAATDDDGSVQVAKEGVNNFPAILGQAAITTADGLFGVIF